jgi:hypothetical protein
VFGGPSPLHLPAFPWMPWISCEGHPITEGPLTERNFIYVKSK